MSSRKQSVVGEDLKRGFEVVIQVVVPNWVVNVLQILLHSFRRRFVRSMVFIYASRAVAELPDCLCPWTSHLRVCLQDGLY